MTKTAVTSMFITVLESMWIVCVGVSDIMNIAENVVNSFIGVYILSASDEIIMRIINWQIVWIVVYHSICWVHKKAIVVAIWVISMVLPM